MIYNFDYVVNHKELRNFLKQSINLLKENKTYENNSMLIVNSFRFCPNLFRLNASLNKMSKTIDLKDLNYDHLFLDEMLEIILINSRKLNLATQVLL